MSMSEYWPIADGLDDLAQVWTCAKFFGSSCVVDSFALTRAVVQLPSITLSVVPFVL